MDNIWGHAIMSQCILAWLNLNIDLIYIVTLFLSRTHNICNDFVIERTGNYGKGGGAVLKCKVGGFSLWYAR